MRKKRMAALLVVVMVTGGWLLIRFLQAGPVVTAESGRPILSPETVSPLKNGPLPAVNRKPGVEMTDRREKEISSLVEKIMSGVNLDIQASEAASVELLADVVKNGNRTISIRWHPMSNADYARMSAKVIEEVNRTVPGDLQEEVLGRVSEASWKRMSPGIPHWALQVTKYADPARELDLHYAYSLEKQTDPVVSVDPDGRIVWEKSMRVEKDLISEAQFLKEYGYLVRFPDAP